LPLATVTGSPSGIGTDCATNQQARAGSDSSALTTSYRCTSRRTDSRTYHRTTNSGLIRRLLTAAATNLPQGKIATGIVVSAKTLHRLPCAWQHHDIRPAGHDGARTN
jgi:hypothetical protein